MQIWPEERLGSKKTLLPQIKELGESLVWSQKSSIMNY